MNDTRSRTRDGVDSSLRSSLRRRSVLALARRFDQSGPHPARVAELATSIFDGLREAHRLPDGSRDLLEFAALLHDVGRFVADRRHERHTWYLVRHGDLRGFRRREIAVIALVARYHRKSPPRKRHAAFQALGARDRRMVRWLAAILRIADSLDRGHRGIVRGASVRRIDRELCLVVEASGDPLVEVQAARRRIPFLEALVSERLRIHAQVTAERSGSGGAASGLA